MTAAVPAAEARALPSATPRPVVPLAPSAPAAVAVRPAVSRAPQPSADVPAAPASRPLGERPAPAPPVEAARAVEPRVPATEGSAVVRNAAGRAIDPAVAERLRADPLVRQVTDILDAPVQRVVPRRGRPAPTQDGEE